MKDLAIQVCSEPGTDGARRSRLREYLQHAVLRAIDPGNTRMQERLHLARVQVAPAARPDVVTTPQRPITLRAGPLDPPLVSDPYVNPFLIHLQLDPIHEPGFLKPQKPRVQLRVFHRQCLRR